MNLSPLHFTKADELLRLALNRAEEGDVLCAILKLDLPKLPTAPPPKDFPNRLEWRRAVITQNKAFVEQHIGGTLRRLDHLGLAPRGGSLGQVVVNGPAAGICSALELEQVTFAILDRELHFLVPST